MNLPPISSNETRALFVPYPFNSPDNRPGNTLYQANRKTGDKKDFYSRFTSRINPRPIFVHQGPCFSNLMNIAWIALGYHTDCPPPEIIALPPELCHLAIVPPGHVCRFCGDTEKLPEEHICPVSDPGRSHQKQEHKFQLEVRRDYCGHIDATIELISKNQNNRWKNSGTNPLATLLTPTQAHPTNLKTTCYSVTVTPHVVSLVEQILINLRNDRRSKLYRIN
jgi:hypothetical protein